MKRFLLQTGITLILVGVILFAVSPPVINVAVVETENETWYDGTENFLPEGETSFTRWVKADERIVIFANVTDPSDPSTALIQVVLTDSDATIDLIDQTTGTLDTDILIMTSSNFLLTVSNSFDTTNDKVVDLTITIEREVVVMREVPNSVPTAGFGIFILGAVFFLIGSFVKGGDDE